LRVLATSALAASLTPWYVCATTMPIAFLQEPPVQYGIAQTVSPRVRRVVARNPGPFSYHGTGTYVIGHGEVAVIDPGPALDEHVDALIAALPNERIVKLLVTHTHNDHSPACRPLQARTGAPTHGFGPHGEGRFERGVKVEAGGDMEFSPDVTLRHGDVVEGDGWSLECVHTPGHCSNHLCFGLREEGALLTGDHVMSWSTSIVSPPDGDMGDYMRSLALLLERDDRSLLPAHGPPVPDPKPFVRAFVEHRVERENQILSCVEQGIGRIAEMVPRMYATLPAFMHPAAARSVLAHVLYLLERGVLSCDQPEPSLGAWYRRR
jgi:glyoxylase-like metal-dependent hydrolase (beta-lactamase superfamily II)